MKFFESYKIEEGITCIKGLTGELMYLIEGKDRAILLDTGLGVGNIKEYVEQLTSLPYIVILSHGHLDHAGGASLFESVYINQNDVSLLHNHSDIAGRKAYLESVLGEGFVPEDAYVTFKEIEYLPIKEGDVIDLGGLTVEVIEAPGHTQGSLCFLIKEKRILFTGDACNNFTFLFLPESLPVEDYGHTIKKLLARDEEYDRVLVSHVNHELPKSVIRDVYECCIDIMEGNVDDIPFNFMGHGAAYIAKKIDPEKGKRADGRVGNIVYRKDNIFSTKGYGY